MNSYSHFFFSIILHVFIFFSFLSVFFWKIISKTESDGIQHQINNLLNKIINSTNVKTINSKFDDIPKEIFTKKIYQILYNQFSGENIAQKLNNNLLMKYNITIIILLLILVIISCFIRIVICKQDLNIMSIILENVIVLILVGGIEYYFFTHFASKYSPILPSYFPTILFQKLKDKLN